MITEDRKHILRQLVRGYEDGKLLQTFYGAVGASVDQVIIEWKGSDRPELKLADLQVLEKEGFVFLQVTDRSKSGQISTVECTLREKAFSAVKADFFLKSTALAQPTKEQPERIRNDFFISYNGADCQWAEWIAWQLEEAGYTTVLQAWDFRPGFNFVLEMQRAATEAERTIAVLSQAYLDALYTQPEWAAAFRQDPTGEKGTLLPVRVSECDLTGLWPQISYIDLVGLDEAAAKDALLAGVRRERAKPTTPPGFPGAAPRSVPEQPRFPRALPLPDLKLLWRGDMATGLEGSSLVLETSEYNDKHFYLLLFAKNEGEAMTAWYRLGFDIPRELARPGSNLHIVQWHKGERTCWSSSISAEMTRHEFKSAGQYPLFPGEEVHIATLEMHLLSQIDYPDEVRIPYSVVTDRTQIQHGECMIRIRPENLTRKTPQ
jgi:hypothetical protein